MSCLSIAAAAMYSNNSCCETLGMIFGHLEDFLGRENLKYRVDQGNPLQLDEGVNLLPCGLDDRASGFSFGRRSRNLDVRRFSCGSDLLLR
jgi:hypothetical protein